MVVGGLLLFGSLAYGLVSLTLITQVDNDLNEAAMQLMQHLQVNNENQFDVRSLAGLQVSEGTFFQVWGNDNVLYFAHPIGLLEPLNDATSMSGEPSYITVRSLRVLSVPVQSSRRPVGVLQIAQSLVLVEAAQQRLVSIMLILAMVITPLLSLAAWFATASALKPLTKMTEIATQITRADDLHHRIALDARPGDEVGQLMAAFNQTMERLENLFNSQNRFIADVSHELRTPLTVIKGNVGIMKQLQCGDDESLDSINAEVDRLTRLVGDLLLLSQAETGHLPMEVQLVELDTILFEILQQMRMLAGSRVQLNISAIDQVRVKADPDRLKQVMVNLIANAIQHTPTGGQVTLQLGKNGNMGFFAVQDTGPGIPEEDLPFIFDRFYRGEKSRTRGKDSGFGLGLSIAKWIVTNHNGSIDVQSTVGEGTLFSVSIPLWDDPAEWEELD
jgi:signal transduction histidine kinase